MLLGWLGDAENSIQNNGKKRTPLSGQQESTHGLVGPLGAQRHLPPRPGLSPARPPPRQTTPPIAFLHQGLPLFLAGVLLPLVGLEQDLLGCWAPLEPVPPSLFGRQLIACGLFNQSPLARVGEFCRDRERRKLTTPTLTVRSPEPPPPHPLSSPRR